MATQFPTALDSFTNPTETSNMDDAGVLHSDQHANANDAIEALQAKVGITNSTDPASIEYKLARKQSTFTFVSPPATATSTGTEGSVVVSGGYMYVCVATNTWVRSAIATW